MTERTDAPAPGRELATRSSSDGQIIRTPQEYRERLTIWHREHYHVLTPFANFSALPSHLGIVPTMVQLDPDPGPKGSGHVYQDGVFTKGNDVAIAKVGLSMIAQAAGMSIETFRTDPRTIPNLWEVKAIATFRGIDGGQQSLPGTEEYDLRDGSPRVRPFTEKQLQQARIKGLRGCEARAINAAIRQFGIKQKYSREELQKPFVVLRVVVTPNMSDPVEKQIVLQNAFGATALLYGDRSLPAAPQHEPIDVIGVGASADESAASSTPAREPRFGVLHVARDMEKGHYDVVLSPLEDAPDDADDLQAVTPAEDVATAFVDAKKRNRVVTVDIEPSSGTIRSYRVLDEPAFKTPDAAAAQAGNGLRNIAEVKVAGTNKPDNPSKWTRYEIVATSGEIWSTFSDTHARIAEEAKAKGWPVRIVDKTNAKFPDQRDIETITLVDPRQGSLLGDNV